MKKIEIGFQTFISENVVIRDSDTHLIKGHDRAATKPIKIGNKAWIGLNMIILKGVSIGDGAVIAAGSLVNRNILSNCLAGGMSATIIKENIKWDNV